ncbi:MAG: DUF3179 domain-containing protein [Balneolaceae bacterium]
MRAVKIYTHVLYTLLFFAVSCEIVGEGGPGNGQNNRVPDISDNWIIPQEEVIDGGPGKDGIPSIDQPDFAPAGEIDYVEEQRLISAVNVGESHKAYPHQVLDWHEIVNDQIEDLSVAMTYCPLTGTGVAWDRQNVEFGVSGLLFRGNLVPYDRQTQSRYSQMQIRGVNGPMAGTQMEALPVLQTTWETWKSMYPDSKVLTTRNTGRQYNYKSYAYGEGYLEEDSATNFPVRHKDDRLPRKKRVHGIIANRNIDENADVRTYVIDRFAPGIQVIEDRISNQEFVVVGSRDKNFAMSYLREFRDGTLLQFEAVQDALPVVMKDQEGNRWDVFGYAVEGPRKGSRLNPTQSYTGYWFAWVDFFPGLEIFER